MTEKDCKNFVRAFLRFLNQQIEAEKFTTDQKEGLEVSIQCLENVFFADDGDTANSSCEVDLFELYRSSVLQVTPERKEEAENLKNEGIFIVKED